MIGQTRMVTAGGDVGSAFNLDRRHPWQIEVIEFAGQLVAITVSCPVCRDRREAMAGLKPLTDPSKRDSMA